MEIVKNICIINGSLRGKKASSLVFLDFINAMLPDSQYRKIVLRVRAKVKESYPEDILGTISGADAVILVFPLFTYGIPAALMRLLEDYYAFARGNGQIGSARTYVIANCAFPRPLIMGELIRVMRNFCRRAGLQWRFAVCLGGGPVAAMAIKSPLLNMKYRKAFSAIVRDINTGHSGPIRDYYLKPIIPEPVLLWVKAQYEKKMKAAAARK
jgi:hypothetical protein